MANERKPGLGNLPAGLLRSTTPPEPVETVEELGEGRGDTRIDLGDAKLPAPRTRRKRALPSDEVKAWKLHFAQSIHDRLALLAFERRTSVSAVAADILDKSLPKFKKLERE